jgi:universal stress protein A
MYRHVLAVVDLSNSSLNIIARAKEISGAYGASLTVLHVCKGHVTGYGTLTSQNHMANEMEVKQTLFPRLKQLLEDSGALGAKHKLLFGRPADMIHKYAVEHQCDLIVAGSHGHTGVKALLGSTANAIFHGASCDVYSVRIED